ncbi:MAG: hypothetical protein ACRDRT_06600, partial [Pseudonocardiaceae bacterium]
LQDHMHLVSVDDHLIEPPGVWRDRLPKKYQELGPTLVEASKDQPLRDHIFGSSVMNVGDSRCGMGG